MAVPKRRKSKMRIRMRKSHHTHPVPTLKNCPKCGTGVKLAEHKDRRACGKCGYFERK